MDDSPSDQMSFDARSARRVLVVSTCSGEKLVRRPDELRQEDFADPARLAARESELAKWSHRAGEMYQGREHATVTNAIALRGRAFGEGVRHLIISAGYGVISPDRYIVPYDVTFNEMPPGEVVPWARQIGIRRDLETEMLDADLVILLLGTRYVWAVEPKRLSPSPGQRLIYVAAPSQRHRINPRAGVTLVPAGTEDAARRGTDNYVQKGFLLERFLEGCERRPEVLGALLADNSPRAFLAVAGISSE